MEDLESYYFNPNIVKIEEAKIFIGEKYPTFEKNI